MCSIFGLTKPEGHISQHQLETIRRSFTNIASNACSRGKDSTGIAIISSKGKFTYKTILSSDKAVLTQEWQDKIVNNINNDAISIIGHTRAATTGAVTTRNAHPFSYGSIIGAHNGIIDNWDEVKGHKDKMQVDSEIIFSRLSRMSYKDALEGLIGYYAVSFVDHNYRKFYLAKEEQAPLRLSYWKKAKTLFYGSTDTILKNGLQKSGLNLSTYDAPDNRIMKFFPEKFDNKPFYTEEKIVPQERFVGVNSVWNNNSYASYYDYDTFLDDDLCDVCDKEEVKPGKYICDNCAKASDYIECRFCGDYFLSEENEVLCPFCDDRQKQLSLDV